MDIEAEKRDIIMMSSFIQMLCFHHAEIKNDFKLKQSIIDLPPNPVLDNKFTMN